MNNWYSLVSLLISHQELTPLRAFYPRGYTDEKQAYLGFGFRNTGGDVAPCRC